jgi:hypothetical protein
MQNNDTLLMGVVFEDVKPYLNKYIESLNNQSTKNFDLLILNDGYKEDIPVNKINNQIISILNNQTSAQIRQFGINYAIENNYKIIIFTDTDDYYSQNYVESLMFGLENNDFVYSNIVPVDNNGITINNYFSLPHETKRYEQIIKYNYVGLGCSAVKSAIIREINIPSDIIAVDWYLYTILLLNGFAGKLVEIASVYYRQHYNNTVGGLKQLDRVRLLKGIDIKEKHYRYIYNYCLENNYESVAKEYEIKYQEMLELKLFLQENINLEKYINTININLNTVYKGWWSEILDLKTWRTYAN